MITSISMDHTKYLGDTLAKIAGEKAGIIKTGVPLIFDDGQPEVSTILEGFAFRRGAARYPVGRDDFHVEEIGEKGLSINARMKDGRCLELEIPFEAFYQAENAMLAVRTLDVLRYPGECPRTGCRMPGHGPCICPDGMEWGISDQHIVKGLKNTFWPGRMEQVRPGIYLDGAHNPGGIGYDAGGQLLVDYHYTFFILVVHIFGSPLPVVFCSDKNNPASVIMIPNAAGTVTGSFNIRAEVRVVMTGTM